MNEEETRAEAASAVLRIQVSRSELGPDGQLPPEVVARLKAALIEEVTKKHPSIAAERAVEIIEQVTGGLEGSHVGAASLRSVATLIEHLSGRMEGIAEGIVGIAQTYDTLGRGGQGRRVFQLGMISEALSLARYLLDSAGDRLRHAADCECNEPSEESEPPS